MSPIFNNGLGRKKFVVSSLLLSEKASNFNYEKYSTATCANELSSQNVLLSPSEFTATSYRLS